ncbi:MAG TPA: AAA family ATPase [Pirellulales bacterium]|nr:AAA family ATPase [Pirellulales bacterium]
MKIASVILHEFKRFRDLSIDLRNAATEEVASQFLILGDNGVGKTTVLQAIALCLSRISHKTRSVEDFDWLGWVPGRFQRWGRPRIELEVHFTDDEILATQEAARRWYDSRRGQDGLPEFIEPPHSNVVKVGLDGDRYWTGAPQEQYLFRGRTYAADLLRTDPSARELFPRLPGVFWFDQFRNLATPPGAREIAHNDELAEEPTNRIAFGVGVKQLRTHLNGWKLARITRGPRPGPDFLLELENLYKRIFPGRSFSDPEPMFRAGVPSPEDYYFTISDGQRTYDIEEMSSGEQAVFPILYEFVRQQIKNSVVLIDEIDLNLHPPLAQSLVNLLPVLGPGCQFIYTTHSEAVSSIVSPEQVRRLEGGRLCL